MKVGPSSVSARRIRASRLSVESRASSVSAGPALDETIVEAGQGIGQAVLGERARDLDEPAQAACQLGGSR